MTRDAKGTRNITGMFKKKNKETTNLDVIRKTLKEFIKAIGYMNILTGTPIRNGQGGQKEKID